MRNFVHCRYHCRLLLARSIPIRSTCESLKKAQPLERSHHKRSFEPHKPCDTTFTGKTSHHTGHQSANIEDFLFLTHFHSEVWSDPRNVTIKV